MNAEPTGHRRAPWHAHLLLLKPGVVRANLQRLHDAETISVVPTLWQIELGVMRMVHRMIFRPDSIGLSDDRPVRRNLRARLLAWRPLRFGFLLAHGLVRPWDLSGLTTSREGMLRHLLGTHHDRTQFVYDLALLDAFPGSLEALRDRARTVVQRDDRASRWLRDLCIYDDYHETLLDIAEQALAGTFTLSADDARNPDVSLQGYVAWCCAQPASPAETWRAWRRGDFRFDSPAPAADSVVSAAA